MTLYNPRTVARARQLHAASGSRLTWDQLDGEARGSFVYEANALLEAEQAKAEAKADEEAARRVAGDAVDLYRSAITSRIPAHRIETRINGFKDGWDAAMEAVRGEDAK